MFTTNVVGANEEQQQQLEEAKAMANTAKFACATVAAANPYTLPRPRPLCHPHFVCSYPPMRLPMSMCVRGGVAGFTLGSTVLCCFLMSCHVLYEMSSASAMPKTVGSVPASGVGGYNTATAAAAAAARYRVKMKGQTTTTTTRTKRKCSKGAGGQRATATERG